MYLLFRFSGFIPRWVALVWVAAIFSGGRVHAETAPAAGPAPVPGHLWALGNARAQYLLGSLFDDGRLVTRNPARAAVWYRQAAEQGHTESQFRLGMLYQFGAGIPVDRDEAEKWYRHAAQQGNVRAQNNLAELQASLLGPDGAALPSATPGGASSADPRVRAQARAAAHDTMVSVLMQFVKDRDRIRARQGLVQSLREDPTYPEPRFNLAKLAEADENWDGAIHWLRDLRATAPASPLAAEAQRQMERLQDIKARCRTSEGERKVRYEARVADVRSLLDAGEDGDALAQATEATHLDDSRYEAYSLMAAAYSHLDQPPEALTAIRTALEKAPADRQAKLRGAMATIEADGQCQRDLATATSAMNEARYKDAATAYESAWHAKPEREGYALRAALAYELAALDAPAKAILDKLVASKDLAVSQAATNQILKMRATQAQAAAAR